MIDESIIRSLKLFQVIYNTIPEENKLSKIAQLYANAFAAEPWNVYKICQNGHYFGIKDSLLMHCNKCNEIVKIAYPEDETIDYIKQELSNTEATLITFENLKGEIFAAGWGYRCTISQLQEKYDSEEMKHKVLAKIKALAQKVQDVFYLSEVMVDLFAQKKGIAKKITHSFIKQAQSSNINFVMRTHKDSPMCHIAVKNAMYILLHPGEDVDNPQRILYIKIRKESEYNKEIVVEA